MRGGKRKGAGRKKGFSAIQAEKGRELLSDKLAASIGPIVDRLIKQAKNGDIRAAQILMERAWGRIPAGTAEENQTISVHGSIATINIVPVQFEKQK